MTVEHVKKASLSRHMLVLKCILLVVRSLNNKHKKIYTYMDIHWLCVFVIFCICLYFESFILFTLLKMTKQSNLHVWLISLFVDSMYLVYLPKGRTANAMFSLFMNVCTLAKPMNIHLRNGC